MIQKFNKLLMASLYAGAFLAVLGLYTFSTFQVKGLPPQATIEKINVAVSPLVQLVLSGGDPFLAANLAVFRATMVTVQKLNPSDYPTLAKVQVDASLLNPSQEDNYYIAQGILPWIGEYRAANDILERAKTVRPFDFMPPFFLGFNYMYFEGEFEKSGRNFEISSYRVDGKDRDVLLNYAAKFMEKGNDPENAIQFIEGLIKATRNQGLKKFLQIRIVRLERLKTLREGALTYKQKYRHPPEKLSDLVGSGILQELPVDPLGMGYKLDEHGVPQIIFQIRRFN